MNYKQNPLGIYVYPDRVYNIDNISWDVNSINHQPISDTINNNQNLCSRCINKKSYGIILIRTNKYKKNPLGIYVYPHDVPTINNIDYTVNSINKDIYNNIIDYYRLMDSNMFGFSICKYSFY